MAEKQENCNFYSGGLKFTCLRCSSCCRHESGYVFLSMKDCSLLESTLKIDHETFIKKYCRWVESNRGDNELSLKEKTNYDCIFWEEVEGGRCSVYEYRPLQCRAFPFWSYILESSSSWELASKDCPGMNNGKVHMPIDIINWLIKRENESIITDKGEA